MSLFGSVIIEAFYSSLLCLLATVGILLLCRSIHFSEKCAVLITYLSRLTMGIYILHPFLLAVMNKFVPAFTQGGMAMSLLFWIGTTVVSGICTAIAQKIPGLKRLFQL